jgi:glycosyltransferase involved in cell wall biosynthesis
MEVFVVDGMSDDDTREILADWCRRQPNLRVLNNPQRIVPTAMNIGIRAARGKIIIRMDAHTTYAPDYISECLAVLEETNADNVGGPARTQSTDYMGAAICAAYHSWFSVGGARFHDVRYEGYVDTVTYGCWRREVFDRIGFFDEELVRNQDDEFNLRLTRCGGKIWQSPRIKSWYVPRGSLIDLYRQYKQYGYWKVRVIQKHTLPASPRHLAPAVFFLSILFLSLFSFWEPHAWWALQGLVGTYFICSVIASFLAVPIDRLKLVPILPVVFACYHFGYSYGFLRGVWDFLILRRRATKVYTSLTRSSPSR